MEEEKIMLQQLFNLIIGLICFLILLYRAELDPVASAIIGFIVVYILEIKHTLKTNAINHKYLPCSYKAEILIEPNYRELMNHEFVIGYYEKALPMLDRTDMLNNPSAEIGKEPDAQIGEHALWRDTFRFLVINNLFWSDKYKTFIKELRLGGKILDYNYAEDVKEPNLEIEIKHGLLRFWFSPSEMFSEIEPKLICEFPLYIFEDIPSEILSMKYGSKEWQNYLKLFKLSPRHPNNWIDKSEKQAVLRHKILAEYGFDLHSEYDHATDVYMDRDGDSQIFDYDDGFTGFKNTYCTIKIKEYFDEV
jgi:hypothetical protein